MDKAVGSGVILSEDTFLFKFSFAAYNSSTENGDDILVDKVIRPLETKESHKIILEFEYPTILS